MFLGTMTVLNDYFGPARPTHSKGNVLDLALVNLSSCIVDFEVGPVGVAASDHVPLEATLQLQRNRPHPKLQGCCFKTLTYNNWVLRLVHRWQ